MFKAYRQKGYTYQEISYKTGKSVGAIYNKIIDLIENGRLKFVEVKRNGKPRSSKKSRAN
jgi:hypothetical protein